MMISPIGKKRFMAYGVLLLLNTIVLGLSGHINQFQKFYYHADVIPFALSLSTMIFILILGFLELNLKDAPTAKPPFELGWLGLSSLLWLAFNSFSTNRWRFVNDGLCKTIPDEPLYASYTTWCNEVQALRAFVWLEWAIFLLMFAFIFRWAFNQHRAGRNDVWGTVISRFYDTIPTATAESGADLSRSPSEFLQWEKFTTNTRNATHVQNSGLGAAQALNKEYHEPAADYNVHTHLQSAYRTQYPSMQYMQDSSNPGYSVPKIHQYYAKEQQQQQQQQQQQRAGEISSYGRYPQAV